MSLLEKSYQFAYQNCIPLMATIELTQDCNFHCSHCYNFDRTADPVFKPTSNKDKSLNKEKVFQILEELNELGSLIINFTGGESTLAKYLPLFISKTRELNMEPRIKTNGSLLSQTKVDELLNNGLAGADISLYGFTEKTYEKFTGKKNSFRNTLNGIESLKQSGIETLVSIILHRDNVDELEKMINYCHEKKILFNISIEMTKRYDGTDSSLNEGITNKQFINLLQGPYKEYFQHYTKENTLQCSCARSIIGIGHQGDVYPCIGSPIKSGNLFKDSLVSIWKNSSEFKKIRNLEKKDFKSCSTCEYINTCNRSSGSIFINTGDYTGCDEKTFSQAKIRSELLD